MKKNIFLFLLFLCIMLGALLRFSGINWDQGYHMHPDERAIVLATTNLSFPTSVTQFLSPQSPWNPHFFAYGSFPLYLLFLCGRLFSHLDPSFAQYDKINLVGRGLSALFDMGTLLLIFFLGKKVKGELVGIIAAFFYAISVLPIQLSHFYAVDTLLTFFVTGTLLLLLYFYERPSPKLAILIGISFGLSLATKASASVLLVSIFLTLTADFFLVYCKHPLKPREWLPHLPSAMKRLIGDGLLILGVTAITYIFFEPYALIDFQQFLSQTIEQSRMTKDAFTFPYTLQYVGKPHYLYELKNVFLWGLGPILFLLFLGGVCILAKDIYKRKKVGKWGNEVIIFLFFLVYFAIVGGFAIGFVRYMLPLYPLIVLCASIGFVSLAKALAKYPVIKRITFGTLFIGIFIWPLSFIHIYTEQNTRVQATNFILSHIPPGSSIAIEHWDDAVPILGQSNYTMETLPLYDPDSQPKWQAIDQTLRQTDYIVLASNRLYVPLQKLTNCATLPPGRCYPKTALYYNHLFHGGNVLIDAPMGENVVFTLDKVFAVYPTIPFLNIPINDQSADESFTVYDHPKILIFKKTN